MNKRSMLVFFIIVFTIYFLTNLYIFLKGYRAIPLSVNLRFIYTIIYILLAATFIAGKILERNHSSILTDILNIIGGFWMAFMLYAFIFLLISDIASPLLRLTGILSVQDSPLFRKWSFIITVVLSAGFITFGFINAVLPVVRKYNIVINKPAGELKTFRIAAVSDIHLGSIIRKRSIKKLSGMLKKINPDVVFLLGDIVDGEIGPVLRDDLLSYFTCPKCKDGLFAITGNHEYIGGAATTIPYIEKNGIKILKDEVVTLDGGIQLIGRIDRDGFRFNKKERLPLDDLMKQVDLTKPVILLDHQPFNLNEKVKAGVDLQLSGHTHNGQMWPLNYITKMIYELSYGYKKIGNTQFIVSSGFGIWGPRVRSGSRPEVIEINITFSERIN
jgi:predicted MPP superfamily phosphohydrolase